ncbi:MAG: hypothetical protein AAF517_16360, partial [Planctomycetota bacterium]
VGTSFVADFLSKDAAELENWQLDVLTQLLSEMEKIAPLQRPSTDARLRRLQGSLLRLSKQMHALVLNPSVRASLRAQGIAWLGRIPPSPQTPLLQLLSDESTPPIVQAAAIDRLRALTLDIRPALSSWDSFSPTVRSTLRRSLVGHAPWTHTLLREILAGRFSASELSAADRQQLTSHRNTEIAQRARAVFGDQRARANRDTAIASMRPAFRLEPSPTHGREVFRRLCSSCHAIGDLGKPVGPDLRSLSDRSRESLLTSILDPNATVEPNYLAHTLVLRSGSVLQGIVSRDTTTEISLQLSDGTEQSIARDKIASIEATERSLMPEGLENDMSLRDFADLIEFLQSE